MIGLVCREGGRACRRSEHDDGGADADEDDDEDDGPEVVLYDCQNVTDDAIGALAAALRGAVRAANFSDCAGRGDAAVRALADGCGAWLSNRSTSDNGYSYSCVVAMTPPASYAAMSLSL